MFDCVKKGLYDLFRNKLRLFLTVGGIAIGVISVLVISTIGDIGKITINKQLDNMGMDNLVITSEKSNVKGLWENDLEVIKNVPEIKNAMPLMNFYTKCSVRDNKFNCMAWGVNEDAKEVIELVPIHGRLLNRGDVANASRVCIIDEKIALENYKRSNIVGKKIQLYANGTLQDFEVVGIVKNGVNALQSMMGEFIPSFVYVPYTTLEQDFSQYYFDQIAVKLDEGASSETAAEQIESAVLSGRDIPVEITVQNLVKQKSQLNNIMSIITIVLSAIGGISLIVSGLSIMTVMLVSVKERTREIGIKKSIGATNTDIMSEFLLESVLITLIGGIIGAFVGIVFTLVCCIALGIAIFVNVNMILGIILFSMVIGLVFGVYPAYRAAVLKPVDALRSE